MSNTIQSVKGGSLSNMTTFPSAQGPRRTRGFNPSQSRLSATTTLHALRRQGYLDSRFRNATRYWRLRFRSGGRLRTVGIGYDPGLVQRVQHELRQLQSPRRRRLELAKITRRGARQLRRAKQTLAPVLAQLGLHFHGGAIRKYRHPFIPNNAINEHNAMNHPISQPFKESVSVGLGQHHVDQEIPRGRR